MKMKALLCAAFAAALALVSVGAHAQTTYKQLPVSNQDYVKPFPPVKILSNLYYVGTYDLAVYAIPTKEGTILINTGVNDSLPAIRKNMEAVGLKLADVKLLLATHGHWDHVAAFAEIKRLTGARMYMHEDDADMLESGGSTDYRFPQGRGAIYEPIKVDRRLKDGDKVRLGEVELTVHHHPGHTKGATSFSYATQEGARKLNVLIANMGSINPGVNVAYMPAFPGITQAYADTFAKQKQLKPDVYVSSHAGHFDLHKKYQPGDAYDPNRFVDPAGYLQKVELYEKRFREQLAKDQKAQ